MKNVAKGNEFVFSDGRTAKNVSTLLMHMKRMSPEEFSIHVNDAKNDFYNWINDCINPAVASDIKNVLEQKNMIEKLTGHHWEHHHKRKFNY